MADATTTTPRLVPGAPPPAPLSKSQRKKRKSVLKPKMADAPSTESILAIPDAKMAALVEKAPEEEEIKKGAVAEELVVQPEPLQEVLQDKSKKPSPAVELLNKRIKVQTKKLSRIAVYSSKPSSELNEDQLKSVATLPAIQGAVRELEETRKAVETLEAEQAKELAVQRAEEEKASNDRISQAISENTHSHQQRLSQILTLLHLSSLLSAADPTTFTLIIDEKERQALYAAAAILLGSDSSRKEEVILGLLLGDGDIDSVTYIRLLELVDSHRNPPAERESTPTPDAPVPEPELEVAPAEQEPNEDIVAEPAVPEAGDSMLPTTSTGSFHFMQESELESTPFEHGAEWIEKPHEPETAAVPVAQVLELPAVIDTGIPLGVNGLSQHIEEPPLSAVSAALDWAADDADGLPSINSLHAKFGTPGDVTPEAPQDAAPATPPAPVEPAWGAKPVDAWGKSPAAGPANDSPAVAAEPSGAAGPSSGEVDEDGFVKAKGGRGRNPEQRPEFRGNDQRGRGRGGFRGDRGGEFRGGYRGRGGGGDSFGGGWRGGDGEFRGRGGFRGDRGRGGDFRGRGGRGGEFRGRGRGDRGGYRGGRGGHEGGGEQGEKQPQPTQ